MNRLADFLPPDPASAASAALNPTSVAMQGSLILGIAAEVRGLIAQGRPICNLTVGDFDARQFPIPRRLRDETVAAYDDAQTSYPPAEGVAELRVAVARWYRRTLDIDVSPDWVVVASGARPVMYSFFRLFLERDDEVVCAVPSWNNGYYAQLNNARLITIPTRPEHDFFPTVAELAPRLRTARVFSLNSPLNPTGTVIGPAALEAVARAVVAENRLRVEEARRPLMWMWDQVYWQLCFGTARHVHPCALVPEAAPYVVTVDAISKAFAATGLRVGWAVLPPYFAERMKALIGHIGAWAPRPEQVATTRLLDDDEAMAAFGAQFRGALEARLGALDRGLAALGVEHLVPQGAMYLSVRFDLFGRPGLDGAPMRSNEDIRRFLLHRAGVAVVPFQAFDLGVDSGWFRMSVGAVSVAELDAALVRLGEVLG